MYNWQFDAKDYNPDGQFTPLPPGDYRVRIEKAEEAKSKTSGADMIKLTLAVSGSKRKLWFYIVFPFENDPDFAKKKRMTNQKLGEVWESFNLKVGDLNVLNWRGKVGAARVKQEKNEQKGEMQNAVSYFLTRKRQEGLKPWQEPDSDNDAPSNDGVQGGDYGSLRDEQADGEKNPWDFS